jgi:hypothetical protein
MRSSGATSRNKRIHDWSEKTITRGVTYADRGNVTFFSDALSALATENMGNGGLMAIGFLGQRDIPGVTLRNAQATLRWDVRPSLWSHAFLLLSRRADPNPRSLRNARLLEVPMYSRMGEFPRPERNAVSESRLGRYDDPELDANAALVAIQMSDAEAAEVKKRAENFNVDRLRYDLWDSLGAWQAYLWSRGQATNPLVNGIPIPAAAYVEMAFEAIGLDLTPGSSERNSAPEHIWNAVVWWHEAFKTLGRKISGYYVLRDPGCSLMDAS